MPIAAFYLVFACYLLVQYRLLFLFSRKLVAKGARRKFRIKELDKWITLRLLLSLAIQLLMFISCSVIFYYTTNTYRVSYTSVSFLMYMFILVLVTILSMFFYIRKRITHYFKQHYGCTNSRLDRLTRTINTLGNGIALFLSLCVMEFVFHTILLVEYVIEIVV